jgi:hypothetical protein
LIGERIEHLWWELKSLVKKLAPKTEEALKGIVISIKIENINPRVHKGFVGLECIRLIRNDYILNLGLMVVSEEHLRNYSALPGLVGKMYSEIHSS